MLGRALTGAGVATVFQPIVDLARGVITGYEALTRFTALPSLPPDRWFTEADRRGLSGPLDAVALRAALAHRPTLPADVFLTVNVEPDSLADAAVSRVLTDAGSLGGVVLELTEHRPVRSYETASDLLRPHRANGVLIAVDDAGAGHAGLQQILRLRPDIVKIDRDLVANVDRDEAKASLIEMMGQFASRIDAWMLAEGVERPEEAARLRRLGVPLAQGYFFGRPAPPWSDIDPSSALVALGHDSEPVLAPTLRPMIDVVPWVDARTVISAAEGMPDVPVAPHVVALDPHGRPVAVLSRIDGLTVPRALSGPCLSIDTRPVDLAHRLSTAPTGAVPDPVPVVDRAGRYVGVVHLRSLLADLAREAPDPTTGFP